MPRRARRASTSSTSARAPSTLIVSPDRQDAPRGRRRRRAAERKSPRCSTTLGITTIDFTVVTHYHIDHISGITELLNAGRVAGTAFDNGDDAAVTPPGTSTSPNSTRGTYLNYVTATGRPGVTRATIQPGQVIDLGGGMRATCIVAGGRLLSGGATADHQRGSEHREHQPARRAQQLRLPRVRRPDRRRQHEHGEDAGHRNLRRPDGRRRRRRAAEPPRQHDDEQSGVPVGGESRSRGRAIGRNNTFGHPNRETVNKYLNTPVTGGNTLRRDGRAAGRRHRSGLLPERSEPVRRRSRHAAGVSPAAAAGHAGQGTLLLATDGTTTYSAEQLRRRRQRRSAPAVHTYPVDGASPGVTADFPPTVIAQTSPVLPLATESVMVIAAVNDRESPISSVILDYAAQRRSPIADHDDARGRHLSGHDPGAAGRRSRRLQRSRRRPAAQTTTSASGYFSGVAPICIGARPQRQRRAALPRIRRAHPGHGHRLRLQPGDQRRLRAGRDRRRSTSTDRPTRRRRLHADGAGSDRRSARSHRLPRRTAAPRHHRIGREDDRRPTASPSCRRARRPRL